MLTRSSTYALFVLAFLAPDSLAREATRLSLEDYVARALDRSDSAAAIDDVMARADLSLEAEERRFDLKWSPVASTETTSLGSEQSIGAELRKRTEFGTEIGIGTRYSRIDNDQEVFSLDNTSTYVRLSQGLFRNWGSDINRSSLTTAEWNHDAAELNARLAQQDIILTAMQLYLGLQLAAERVEKSKLSLDRAQQNFESSKSRHNVGIVSKIDVYRAEIALLGGEEELRIQQQNHQDQLERFRDLLAMYDETILPSQAAPSLVADWKGLNDAFVFNHPEWQLHQIAMEKANLRLRRAEHSAQPDITLDAVAEQVDYEQPGTFLEDGTVWSVQLRLNSTFDAFDRQADVERARIAYAEMVRLRHALERSLKINMSRAVRTLKTDQQRLHLQEQRREQALNSVDLARSRYSRGLSDNLDLIQAEEALRAAELDIIASRNRVILSEARLAAALGRLDLEWLASVSSTVETRAMEPESGSINGN